MTITQSPFPDAQPFRNQQLFSDYYLNVLLPQRGDWQMLAPAAVPVLQEIQTIWHAYTPSSNEAQTERDLIMPILNVLGHTFEVQAPLQTPGSIKRPDYIFYRDQATLEAHKDQVLTDTLLRSAAIAVGDAKHWDRPLDVAVKRTSADPFSNKNPSYQIDFYMRHSGAEWGILTNGRLWRLYHTSTAHKLDRFYEVDLPALLETGDADAFLYFFAFFHRSAFDDHPLGIEALRRESRDYAQGIGEHLKQQVFTALRHLAQGFLDYPQNQLQPDPATLQTIYDHCLIVLYRLLFIFYAEARNLLPVRASDMYRRKYSITAIKHDIARLLDAGDELLPSSSGTWARLRDLFGLINLGSPPLQVATFDGGLFDPQRYPFLEQHTVGDARLQQALDLLARVERQFVDYRDLSERHLGTIYEGLLEHHLRPLDTPEEYWTIDLFNDRGERKVTGSYYTPDFVVDYIIAQTLEPLLHEAVAGVTADDAKVQAVLALNVLDPSMGSGHFLVAATEYLARFLVDLDIERGEEQDEADLAYWKRRVVQACIYGVDLNPLAVDLAKLSLWLATVASDKPLSFLDHHLRCGNALVGARLEHLRPAADRKQRQAQQTVQRVRAAGQRSMLEDSEFRQSLSSAVDRMAQIEQTAGDTIREVRMQEQLYADIQAHLTTRYRPLADLVTATHFGVAIKAGEWETLRDYALGRNFTSVPGLGQRVQMARQVADAQRFFHWELAFPDVFFTQQGAAQGAQAGFDAVVGNPPYVRQESLTPLKPYLADTFAESYHGAADIYVYFYQQGLQMLRQGGRLSYIVTNKWLRAGYGEPLRGYFARAAVLERIIDFGHAPIFPEADVFPCIVVLTKPKDPAAPVPANHQVQITEFPRRLLGSTTVAAYVAGHSHPVPQQRLGTAAWSLEPANVDTLLEKIKQAGVPLAEFAGVKPYRGVLTGLNDAFLIDTATRERLIREDPGCTEIIKPYLRGRNIKRWSPDWDGQWMLVLKSSENQQWPWSTQKNHAEQTFARSYPSLYQHLKPFEARLRERQDQGRFWWELRSCAYYDAFEQPKIITQDLATYAWFCFDDRGFYTANTCYIWTTADRYVLACLCSPLMWWVAHRTLQRAINATLRMFTEQVEALPIAPPSDAIRARVEPAVERLIAITQANQESRRTMLDWLHIEFDIAKPGQKLADFASLSSDEFVAAVRTRRPKAAKALKPADLKALREGYTEQATPVQQRRAEALQLERRLADLVNAAYGLTPAEVDLLWQTAPPRMPISRGGDAAADREQP